MNITKGAIMTQKIRNIFLSVFALFFAALPAAADEQTEKYVEANANEVLASLNDPTLDSTARTATFSSYMDEFADIRSISRFVLGKYARRISDEEFETFATAFRTYMLAVYEIELDRYRGEKVIVLGSDEVTPRIIDVATIIPQENGDPFKLDWRVKKHNGEYKVVDVGLKFDGQHIWLGIYQQDQFTNLLAQNQGNPQALLDWMDRETAKLETQRLETAQVAASSANTITPASQN